MKDEAMLPPTSAKHFTVCKVFHMHLTLSPANHNYTLKLKPGELGFSSIQAVGSSTLELRCNWTLKNWVRSQRGFHERDGHSRINTCHNDLKM